MDHRRVTAGVAAVLAGLLGLASGRPCRADVIPDVGIAYGPPLRLSAYGELWLGDRRWAPGLGAQVGAGGSSFSFGLAHAVGRDALEEEYAYLGLRAAITFTGRRPLHALPRSTYAGLRGEVGVVWLGRLSVGVDVRIGPGRRDTRVVWSISLSPIFPALLVAWGVAEGAPSPGM